MTWIPVYTKFGSLLKLEASESFYRYNIIPIYSENDYEVKKLEFPKCYDKCNLLWCNH